MWQRLLRRWCKAVEPENKPGVVAVPHRSVSKTPQWKNKVKNVINVQ